ncbi:MAG: uracil-DNA glycosylase [Gemmataceae bacterium]|nr:uracil-DNA glycosylase [Gemmataceae bacterium]MDW8264565.1 uracil-DNA glycosylase [Gemmataceae bacterium]
MADEGYDTRSLSRQVRQHLEALKLAGVEWLPAAAGRRPPAAARSREPARPTPEPSPAGVSVPVDLFSLAQPEAPPQSPDDRRRELQLLAKEVARCARCSELYATRTQTVFGVGPVGAELCFVGEAPGADEDAQGEPFVGAAGQLLNRIIAACGFKREEVYICNIIKCRPPGNRQPLPHEAANCRPYLERQLELVAPKFLCALGAVAAQNLLGKSVSISRLRGSFQSYRGIPVLCTYHPAYLLRNPSAKRDVWEDMKKLLARMGRPVPKN